MKSIIGLSLLTLYGCSPGSDCNGDETDLMSCCTDYHNGDLGMEHEGYYSAACEDYEPGENVHLGSDTGTDSDPADDPEAETTRFRIQLFSAQFSEVDTGGIGELGAPKVTACIFLMSDDADEDVGVLGCSDEQSASFSPTFDLTVVSSVDSVDQVALNFAEYGEDPVFETRTTTGFGRYDLSYPTLQSLSGTGALTQPVSTDLYRGVTEVTFQVDVVE
jgi:hypothetical protein